MSSLQNFISIFSPFVDPTEAAGITLIHTNMIMLAAKRYVFMPAIAEPVFPSLRLETVAARARRAQVNCESIILSCLSDTILR
jgi:hypothetical protein